MIDSIFAEHQPENLLDFVDILQQELVRAEVLPKDFDFDAYKEQEWRLVIPTRDDGVHLNYFNVDQETKRNMTSCVRAVYIGPNFWKLLNANQYMCEINNKWGTNVIPIYQVINENGRLRIEKVNKRIKRNNEKIIR